MNHGLRRILFVDDEPDIRTVVRIALERSGGLDVALAENAEEALHLLEQQRPDMILLDVMMPGMDGPAMLARLRSDERWRDLPVVFMTAKAQSREIETYRRMGALDVVPKPFDPFTLAGQLRTLWMRHQKKAGNSPA